MVFLLITVAFVGYAWRAPAESIYRVAVLTNAKPPEEEIVKLLEDRPERIVSLDEESIAAAIIASEEAPPLQLAVNSEAPEALTLPSEFDQFEPTAELLATTELGEIDFSTEINDDYEAVNPGLIFPEGFYTLYATFSYDDMADGMEWAWVWRHNGEVIEGGNELWAYGEDGPGYIYFNPEEGFQSGKYSLEVWVNGDLLTTSTAVMNSSAAAASN